MLSREMVFALLVFGLLLSGYVILSVLNNENAGLLGELLKIVTVAVVSYFFGYRRGVLEERLRRLGLSKVTEVSG